MFVNRYDSIRFELICIIVLAMKTLIIRLIIVIVLFPPTSLQADDYLAVIDSLYGLMGMQSGKERAETLLEISELYRNISFDKSFQEGHQAIDQADLVGYPELKAKAFRSLGTTALYMSDYDLALEYCREGLILYEELNDLEGVAACYNNIGVVNEMLGESMNAIDYYNKAVQIDEELENITGVGLTLRNIGNIYYRQGLFDQAMDSYYRSRLIFEDNDDELNTAGTISLMGNVYWQWDEIDKSIQAFTQALETFNAHGNLQEGSKAYNNLGLIYLNDLSDYEKGINYLLQSIEMKRLLGDTVSLMHTQSNLAYAYIKTGKFLPAADYLSEAIEIFDRYQNAHGRVLSRFYMGLLYQETNDFIRSIDVLEVAMNLSEQLGVVHLKPEIIKMQMKNYVALGDIENFQVYYDQFVSQHDTIAQRLNRSQANELRARERFDLIMRESNELIRQNQKLNKKLSLYQFSLTTIICLVLVWVLYVFFRRLKHTRQKRVKPMAQS